MAINKVILENDVLIDLTKDSVTPNTLLVGSTAHAKNGEQIEGACRFDSDTSSATATESDVLEGRTAFAKGKKVTGNIPIKYSESGSSFLTDDPEHYTIPSIPTGYYTTNSETTPSIQIRRSLVDGALGIDAAKIMSGKRISNVDGTATSDANATSSDILEGKTGYVYGEKVTGTIPVNTPVQKNLTSGETYTVPEGYHDGTDTISAPSLDSVTPGDAETTDILEGKTAWVNGEEITGSIAVNEPVQISLTSGETYTVPEGYHDGTDTVKAPDLDAVTPGDAISSDILSGKTAWVNGEQVVGSIDTYTVSEGDEFKVLESENYYGITNFPEGFYPNTEETKAEVRVLKDTVRTMLGVSPEKIVAGEVIAGVEGTSTGGIDTSDADATSSDILEGKTAYVDSRKITGNIVTITEVQGDSIEWTGENTPSVGYPGTATASDILEGKTAWVNGVQITGTIINKPAVNPSAGWQFLTRDNERYAYVSIPFGDYAANFEDEEWRGNEGSVIRLPAVQRTITPNESTQNIESSGSILEKVVVNPIPEDYVVTDNATATASDILSGKTAYVAREKITGAMPDLALNSNIEFSSSNNSKVIPAANGYFATNTDGTNRLMFKLGTAGYVRNSDCVIGLAQDGVASLIGLTAGKLLQSQSCLGVDGTATSDANATSAQILESNTAYVKGTKITGTMTHLSNRSTVKFSTANITPVVVGDACYLDKNTDNVERAMIRVNPGGYIQGGAVVGIKRTDMITSVTSDSTLVDSSYLLSGETAYSKGVKVTGTMTNHSAYTNPHDFVWGGSSDTINNFHVRIDKGAYLRSTSTGYPEIILSNVAQSKTITPTISVQNVSADSGKLLKSVSVGGIPSNWFLAYLSSATSTLDTLKTGNSTTITLQNMPLKDVTYCIIVYATRVQGGTTNYKEYAVLGTQNNWSDTIVLFGTGSSATSYNNILVTASFSATTITITYTVAHVGYSRNSSTCGVDTIFTRK